MRWRTFCLCVGFFCKLLTCQVSPQSLYQTALVHVQQGQNELAIPLIEKLLASSPNDLKARNLLGIALLNSGRRDEAGAQFRKAIELDARFVPALKNLGVVELSSGKQSDARTHFEQVLKLAPADPVAHFNLGELDYSAKRYAQAVSHYQRSGGLHLKDHGAALRALHACLHTRNAVAAIQIGEQLNRTTEVLGLLAQAYELNGDTQRAYDALRAATQLEPSNEGSYLDLMALCLEHHAWELSLEISEVALHHVPQSWRVRLQRGAVLALKGDVAAGEYEFRQASRIAPREPLPQISLALALVQLNRNAEAIQVLRSCRANHPRDYVTNWILGETLVQQPEDESEALVALEDAALLAPQEAAPKALLGKLLARRGDLARATRELEAALRIAPEDAAVQYQLATVYRKAGNTARADQLFDKVGRARSEKPEEAARQSLEQIIRKSSR